MSRYFVLNICLADLFGMQLDPYLSRVFGQTKKVGIWQNSSPTIIMAWKVLCPAISVIVSGECKTLRILTSARQRQRDYAWNSLTLNASKGMWISVYFRTILGNWIRPRGYWISPIGLKQHTWSLITLVGGKERNRLTWHRQREIINLKGSCHNNWYGNKVTRGNNRRKVSNSWLKSASTWIRGTVCSLHMHTRNHYHALCMYAIWREFSALSAFRDMFLNWAGHVMATLRGRAQHQL